MTAWPPVAPPRPPCRGPEPGGRAGWCWPCRSPSDTVADLAEEADQVVCLAMPADFGAVGAWYDDFRQTTDDEVVALLDRAAAGGLHLNGGRRR